MLDKMGIGEIPSLYNRIKQEKLLGPFNKPDIQLPFAGSFIDFRLFGLSTNPKTPTEAGAEILEELKDLRPSDKIFAVFLGQSGCGKTRSLFDIASEHFLMYIECLTTSERVESTYDVNFVGLVRDLHDLATKYEGYKFILKATCRIEMEFCARFLYLYGLLEKKPDLTPLEYLLGQINGGQTTINRLINLLKIAPTSSFSYSIQLLFEKITQRFPSGKKLVIGIDEASVASKEFFGRWKSPSNNDRGLLTGITGVIANTTIPVSVVYAGTALSLLHADSIQSDIGKTNQLMKITSFQPSKDQEPREWLESVLNITGCESVWNDPNVILSHLSLLFFFNNYFYFQQQKNRFAHMNLLGERD